MEVKTIIEPHLMDLFIQSHLMTEQTSLFFLSLNNTLFSFTFFFVYFLYHQSGKKVRKDGKRKTFGNANVGRSNTKRGEHKIDLEG